MSFRSLVGGPVSRLPRAWSRGGRSSAAACCSGPQHIQPGLRTTCHPNKDLFPTRLPRRTAVSGCMLQRPPALLAWSGSSALWVICQQLAYQSARTPAHPLSTPPQPRAVMLTQTHVYKPSESQTLWDELPQQKHWLNQVSMWQFKGKVLTTQSRILFFIGHSPSSLVYSTVKHMLFPSF